MEQELLTLSEPMSSPPVFSGICVARSLVFCVMFCGSLFVLLSFFFWTLCCLSFFDLRILITPLVSSSSSSIKYAQSLKTWLLYPLQNYPESKLKDRLKELFQMCFIEMNDQRRYIFNLINSL